MLGGGGGAGNNWASGFYEHGAEASALAVERVRREAERADCLGGLLLVHSVAGGVALGLRTEPENQIGVKAQASDKSCASGRAHRSRSAASGS